MAISFFVLLGVIDISGWEYKGSRGFHIERSSDCGNQTCQFWKLKVEKGLKNHMLTVMVIGKE